MQYEKEQLINQKLELNEREIQSLQRQVNSAVSDVDDIKEFVEKSFKELNSGSKAQGYKEKLILWRTIGIAMISIFVIIVLFGLFQ